MVENIKRKLARKSIHPKIPFQLQNEIHQLPQQLFDTNLSSIDQLEIKLKIQWVHLRAARNLATEKRKELTQALQGLNSTDTSIVIAGSLARNEYTIGSDIDWYLLIDGRANSEHDLIFKRVDQEINGRTAKPVGPDGIFNVPVFSHEILHAIGGEKDTRYNMIRRLVLFLESEVVGNKDAYNCVKRILLERYLLDDHTLWSGTDYHVLTFLQNDIAQFWRNIAVNLVYKRRKRSGKGFAIRNIKLRMSRKLIYVSGMIVCFWFHLNFTDDERKALFANTNNLQIIINHIESAFQKTPLEIIAEVLLRYPHLDEAARMIMDSYDQFVGTLADQQKRTHLENLTLEQSRTDKIYQELYEISRTFEDGFIKLLFDSKSNLDKLTKHYGVFGSDI